MKAIQFLVCIVFLAGASFADMVVEQKIKSDLVPGQGQGLAGQPPDSTMTMSVKGQRARVDLPASRMSSIIDLKEGKMYTMVHSQKQVMVMAIDDLQKATALPTPAKSEQGKPTVKKTGKVEKIRGYKCAQYEIIGSGPNPSTIYCWITEEVDAAEMEQFRSFGGKMGGLVGLGGVEHPKGMVIRSEAKMNVDGRNVKSETEVQGIKRDPIPDSVFAIPADYQVMEMPKFGSGFPAPGGSAGGGNVQGSGSDKP